MDEKENNKSLDDTAENLLQCCDVTPLHYEQYELRFDHYISDDVTGKRIRLEEPISVRALVPVSKTYRPTYAKNEILQRMIWEMDHKLKESED